MRLSATGDCMSIYEKPLSDLTLDDIVELVTLGARENESLEFKGTLPFVPTKNQPQTADRWIEVGDRIGDLARDEILAEIVAFANAGGGTLILGVHETKGEARRAERIEALPNCEQLALRLLSSAEDIVEPRLSGLAGIGLPVGDDGSGIVVMRVGPSPYGPHRLSSTREFYVRRGERSSKMTAREVRDLSLELARAGDRIEQVMHDRHILSLERFERIDRSRSPSTDVPPLLLRATAMPVSGRQIDAITDREDLWWIGGQFSAEENGREYRCGYPARDFGGRPAVRLRALEYDNVDEGNGINRLINDKGLIEFSLIHGPRQAPVGQLSIGRIYIGWMLGLFVGTINQAERLKRLLGWEAETFAIDIAAVSEGPVQLKWDDNWSSSSRSRNCDAMVLPRYELSPRTNLDSLVTLFVKDLWNAWGVRWQGSITVPWPSL